MEALTYREHSPSAALRAYVRCIWELAGPGGATSQLIVPDGCMELVLNFADPFQQIAGERLVRQPRAMVVGELRRPVTTHARGKVDLVGIRFEPGAMTMFLDGPVREVVDVMADSSPLSTSFARNVEALFGVEPDDRLRLLERALVDHVHAQPLPQVAIRRAVRALVASAGSADIESLADQAGVSRRHLERQFLSEVGVAPKVLANVLRFRRVLSAIEDHVTDWADVAVECGYYDQSHLIRDFKRFTGITPGAYLREGHPLSALFGGSIPRTS